MPGAWSQACTHDSSCSPTGRKHVRALRLSFTLAEMLGAKVMTDAMATARLTTWADLLLGVAVGHGLRGHSLF